MGDRKRYKSISILVFTIYLSSLGSPQDSCLLSPKHFTHSIDVIPAMSSIYRIFITDFGSLQPQIRKKYDSILVPVIPRVGDIIAYFYSPRPDDDDIDDVDLKVTSVRLFCQPEYESFKIKQGQESHFWDQSFDHHAEITVDKAD